MKEEISNPVEHLIILQLCKLWIIHSLLLYFILFLSFVRKRYFIAKISNTHIISRTVCKCMQRRIYNPLEHLRWSFFEKIINKALL